jgi:HAD superfamily hydrolase (TIGR01509 family)
VTQAIIFDCFGVLTADTWREFAATLPDDQYQQARMLNRAYGAAEINKDEFRQAIHDLTGRLPQDVDELLDHETIKNTRLLDYIAELKQSYKIGLLSNVGSNWIRDRFLTPEEQKLFDAFIFSYEVHMTKPDPRMFELAAAELDVPLVSCILVDDVDTHCLSAQAAGLRTVQYHDFPQVKRDLEALLVD